MIRVGIVGYGFAGRGFHAYLIRRVEALHLKAAVTTSPERRAEAERDGLKVHESLEAMLAADDVDLVVLATPHNTHFDLARQALRAGKHVVIDKPMCLTLAEADQLIVERGRAGTLLSVFHNRRWDWDYLTVKQQLEAGSIGALTLVETAVLRYKAPRGWRGQTEAGGGLLYDWGAHLVDQALQLVPGPVAAVTCETQHRGWGGDAGSYVRLQLRFASGVLYGIEIGNLAAIAKPRWYVLGEQGGLVKTGLDPQEPAMLTGDITAAVERAEDRARLKVMHAGVETENVLESVRSDWTEYYRNIAATLAGTAPLAVTAEQARRVIALLEAATRAATTHFPVAPEA